MVTKEERRKRIEKRTEQLKAQGIANAMQIAERDVQRGAGLGKRDRLELAQARAKAAELPEALTPVQVIPKKGLITAEEARIREEEAKTIISPEMEKEQIALEEKQAAEQEALRTEMAPTQPLTAYERSVAAGGAFYENIAVALGIIDEKEAAVLTSKDIELIKSEKPIAATTLALIGKISTIGFGKYRISALVDTSGNIANLQSDASEAVRFSSAQLTFALTRSPNRPKSNIDDALKNAQMAEEAIRLAYNQAMLSLRVSPTDIADGLDLTDAMRTDLGIAMGNRQMLERYKISNDPAEIQVALSGQINLADI